MPSVITTETYIAAATTVLLAALFGYLGQGRMGAILLGLVTAIASGVTVAGAEIGLQRGGALWTWIGVGLGALLGGVVGSALATYFIRGRSFRVLLLLWLAYCALAVFGYLAGGWLGLLTITLPVVLIFWISLYRVARWILPLDQERKSSLSDRIEARNRAFRTLMTYTLGTNYPYYFVKDGKAEERVGGNPYGQFFAGPGFVYTGCDHAAYVTDGIHVRGAYPPGLSFTQMFDLPPKVLDLRDQLRAFHVEALTRDGIPIRVLVFAPFRVPRGGEEPRFGHPFPFRRRAVFKIVSTELVERQRRPEAEQETHEWDGTLVQALVTPIVQDVISKYTVDELCHIPGEDPRVLIAGEIRNRMRRALRERGIELIGGGISNLVPLKEEVVQRRLENWRTEWEEQILEQISEGKAERARQIELARVEAEAEIVIRFAQAAERGMLDGPGSDTALALRFVDCLGEIVSDSTSQWPLPESVAETLQELRGEIEGRR